MTDVTVGRIVYYYQGNAEAPNGYDKVLWQGNNGTRVHPAIVTRVLTENCVNLMVMYDATAPMVRREVTMLPTGPTAETHESATGWFWPPVAEVSA